MTTPLPPAEPPSPELPSFAAQWVQQWKDAAPVLQAIRDEELRRLGHGNPRNATVAGVQVFDRYPERHGMVQMQRWLMRGHLLEQLNLPEQQSSAGCRPDAHA